MRRRLPPAGSQEHRPSPGLRAAWRRRRARGGPAARRAAGPPLEQLSLPRPAARHPALPQARACRMPVAKTPFGPALAPASARRCLRRMQGAGARGGRQSNCMRADRPPRTKPQALRRLSRFTSGGSTGRTLVQCGPPVAGGSPQSACRMVVDQRPARASPCAGGCAGADAPRDMWTASQCGYKKRHFDAGRRHRRVPSSRHVHRIEYLRDGRPAATAPRRTIAASRTPGFGNAHTRKGGLRFRRHAASGSKRTRTPPIPGLRVQPSNFRQRQCRGVRGLESTRGTCQSLRTYDPRSDMRQRAACPSPASCTVVNKRPAAIKS